jgi:hypothetical protein
MARLRYRFLTTWLLETSCAAAWDVLQHPLGWPDWWRGVVRARELDVVMRWGGEGLARRLGVRLLAAG